MNMAINVIMLVIHEQLCMCLLKLQILEYVYELRPKSNPVTFQFQSLTCTKCMVLQKTAHT